jgi:hypothetical protein
LIKALQCAFNQFNIFPKVKKKSLQIALGSEDQPAGHPLSGIKPRGFLSPLEEKDVLKDGANAGNLRPYGFRTRTGG